MDVNKGLIADVKQPFERHILLQDYVREKCKNDLDLRTLLEGLRRGDLVAGFTIPNTSVLGMFCIPRSVWNIKKNEDQINGLLKNQKSNLSTDISGIGVQTIIELHSVLHYIDNPGSPPPKLVVTNRQFRKLPTNGLSKKMSSDLRKKVQNIAEAFIIDRKSSVTPMVDVKETRVLTSIIRSNIGREPLSAPDIFWTDLINIIYKHQSETGNIIKQDALIHEMQSNKYYIDKGKDKNILSDKAIKDRARQVWIILKKIADKK